MVHLYCGDGKGKTTAAAGLALRAAGNGLHVSFIQFMKGQTSGEITLLETLPQVDVIRAGDSEKFTYQMDEHELELCRARNDGILKSVFTDTDDSFELIVLDEVINAAEYDLIDEALLKEQLLKWGRVKEIVITGRTPEKWMIEAADYVTDMEKIRHPFDTGTSARCGIEY